MFVCVGCVGHQSETRVFYSISYNENLAAARDALAKDDAAEAGRHYSKIGVRSPLFAERLEDQVRWHISQQNFQEAWRLTEVARRIRLDVASLDYYTALAATRHGTCTLSLLVDDPLRRLLLHAYLYRFHNRYASNTYSAQPYDLADAGIHQSHLIISQEHYLSDIAKATLLKRSGCRFFYGRFSSRKTASLWEYNTLQAFRNQWNVTPSGNKFKIDDVELRMIELAEEHKDKDMVLNLLENYEPYGPDSWNAMAQERRQFLWQKLVQYERYPAPPYGKDSPHYITVLNIVKARPPDEGIHWLALIKWYDIDRSERLPLLNHLLEAQDPRYRPFFLTAKAELLYERGDVVEALSLVRQLLLLGESGGDPEIERRVAFIASEILAEFVYSERILGALQNSVPAGRWSVIFRSLLLKHAVTGNQRGLDLITKIMRDAGRANQLQLDPEQTQLVSALVKRDFQGWHKIVQKWSESRRIKTNALRILADLSPLVVALNDEQYQRIKSFTDSVTTFLRRYLMQGEQQVRIQELLMIFDRERGSEWAKGGVTVGASAVAVGRVDLRDGDPLPPPFAWNPPSRLPPADLLLYPDGAGSRGWILR